MKRNGGGVVDTIVEYPVKSIAKGGNTTGSDVSQNKDTDKTSTNTVSKYKSKLLSKGEKKEEDNGRRERYSLSESLSKQ